MKVAAAVLGASLLFFLGVLTGAGRREAVPPPAAIPLGAVNEPAGSGASRPTSPAGAPKDGAKGTTTTTGRTGATAPPVAGTTPTSPTGTTPTTAPAAPTTASSSTTTTGSGQVQQVDNQVDCTSPGRRGKGNREPCPSTTSSTGETPGGAGNR